MPVGHTRQRLNTMCTCFCFVQLGHSYEGAVYRTQKHTHAGLRPEEGQDRIDLTGPHNHVLTTVRSRHFPHTGAVLLLDYSGDWESVQVRLTKEGYIKTTIIPPHLTQRWSVCPEQLTLPRQGKPHIWKNVLKSLPTEVD